MDDDKNYISVSVRQPWNGQLAVRDKYIKQCKREKKGLKIVFPNGDRASLIYVPFENVTQARKSTTQYQDRFSNKKHYLYYFSIAYYNKKDTEKIDEPEQLGMFGS